MSCSAPIRDQIRLDSSSGIRIPLTRSATQPRMSVSQERYSKAVPCGRPACRVARYSYIEVGSPGWARGAQPTTCSSVRTSAAGFRYSSENVMPERMSSTSWTVAPR